MIFTDYFWYVYEYFWMSLWFAFFTGSVMFMIYRIAFRGQ